MKQPGSGHLHPTSRLPGRRISLRLRHKTEGPGTLSTTTVLTVQPKDELIARAIATQAQIHCGQCLDTINGQEEGSWGGREEGEEWHVTSQALACSSH